MKMRGNSIGPRSSFFTAIPGIIILGLIASGCEQHRFTDVEFVATPQLVVNEMLKMAKVTKDDVVYDLGCGDGRIIISAAKMFGARGVGVDLDQNLINISNRHAREKEVQNRVKFIKGDFFQTDLKEATVVALYLTPELNVRLRQKFFKELKPGTRIVSNDFTMGEWKPDDMDCLRDVQYEYPDRVYKRNAYYYLWTIPQNVSGHWRFSLTSSKGKQDFTLRLFQKFQEVEGTMNTQGRERVIADTRLAGNQFSFTVRIDETASEKTIMWFHGRATGTAMEGVVKIPGGETAGHYHWLATREK
jgi:ubiquinone/menaquinone biosynthesis C-methylase UbiE